MTDPAIATAADYADALLTARRAKNLLVLIVLLMLLIQMAVFFVVKYTGVVYPTSATATPTTAPAAEQTWHSIAQYAVGISVFVGVAGTVLAALVLYLIAQIMVVGRLIGVSRVINALVWTFVVLMLIFPWQAFLRDQDLQSREWIFPGVLYSWNELIALVTIGTRGRDVGLDKQILHWARFVAWPLIAVVLLLSIQIKSNRGLRQALGEEVLNDDLTTTPAA